MRTRPRHSLLFTTLALFLGTLGVALGQRSDPLVTDRPDQTESAITVAPAKVQIELGGSIELDTLEVGNRRNDVVINAPAILVRIGLLDALELRAGAGWVRESYERVDPNAPGGLSERIGTDALDVQLGGKLSLVHDRSQGISAAILGQVSFSVVGDNRPVAAEIRGSVAQEISSIFSLGLNLGGELVEGGQGGGFYTVVAGIDLNEDLGTFVEVYGDMPWQDRAEQSFDTGLIWAPAYNFQIDIAAGFGLNVEAPDAMVGLGFSWRLPD